MYISMDGFKHFGSITSLTTSSDSLASVKVSERGEFLFNELDTELLLIIVKFCELLNEVDFPPDIIVSLSMIGSSHSF